MMRKFFALAALLAAVTVVAEPAKTQQTEFQAPKLSTADSWSMIVVPDVQTYTKLPRNHGIVEIMNAWIVENADKMKIQQVLYTGDLTYHNDHPMVNPGKNDLMADEQWKAFSRMMERLDEEVQKHTNDIQNQQSDAREHDHAVLLVGDQLVEHLSGDDGVDDTHQRHQKGGQHIQSEYELVGAVVGDEAFEHGCNSFNCAQSFN